jgi:hypothetical protein
MGTILDVMTKNMLTIMMVYSSDSPTHIADCT